MLTALDYYKQEMEIDYYAYFAKTYFAFNCYLRDKYKDLNDDRARIDSLKREEKLAEDKFKYLLIGTNINFFNDLVSLKNNLAHQEIKNLNKIVEFGKVKLEIYNYKDNILMDKIYKKDKYSIKITKDGKIVININSNSFSCSHEELGDKIKKNSFSQSQQDKILSIIKKEFNDYIKDVSETIDSLKFKYPDLQSNSTKKFNSAIEIFNDNNFEIYKAFIEIIYLMRNALFHSEIRPSNDQTKIAYEKAYWLLREFVKTLS